MKKNRISLLITQIALVAVVPLTTFAQSEQGERPPVPRDVAEAEGAKSKGLIQLAAAKEDVAPGKRSSNTPRVQGKLNPADDAYYSSKDRKDSPTNTEIVAIPAQKPGACVGHCIDTPIRKNSNPFATPTTHSDEKSGLDSKSPESP